MSDRERCDDCAHFTEQSTCDFPVPAWVDSPPVILDPTVMRTCNTFSQKMEVVHISPSIDESCDHVWPEDGSGQTDMYGACTKCGLSFQRYIHSGCP